MANGFCERLWVRVAEVLADFLHRLRPIPIQRVRWVRRVPRVVHFKPRAIPAEGINGTVSVPGRFPYKPQRFIEQKGTITKLIDAH